MFKDLRKLSLLTVSVCTLVILVSTFYSELGMAHNEGPSMDDFGLDAGLQVLQNASELAPRFVIEDDGEPKPEIVPAMRIGGKKVYINSYMFELVKHYVRYYYAELERDMPGCQVAPLGQVLNEVEEMAAGGFVTKKVLEPLGTAVSHIAISSADIGGRLGNTAFGAKIAAEIGEGVLSKAVGGGGVHVFCSAIDALILFQTRGLQTAYRDVGYSKQLGTSALRTFAYQGMVSAAVSRAQQRVAFEFEPFEVDEHELEEVDEEGPQRLWGWIDSGKRAKWVQAIAKRAEKNERKNKQLGENQLSKLAQIGSKDFLATRYKRFLWLKGRKFKNRYMDGKGLMDKALGNKRMLWILSVQENVLHRSLLKDPTGVETGLAALDKSQRALPNYGRDEVREGLAAEYAEGDAGKAEEMNKLLMDIERIFDPSQSKRVRYMQTLVTESLLTGFFYRLLDSQVAAMYPRDGNWAYRMWKAFQVHWFTSKYAYYSHQFADYLRIVALQDKPELLMSRKYESMETLVRIFKHLSVVVPKAGLSTQEWLDEMSVSNRSLKTFTPWKEKRSQYSWLPFVPWREKFAKWSFLPNAEDLWGIIPKLPSRAPLCIDMDVRKRVL